MSNLVRTVLATVLGVVLAALLLYGSCAYLVNRKVHQLISALPPPIFPAPAPATFQQKMISEGYLRDHLSHCWVSSYGTLRNGCRRSWAPLDDTFTCATPLNPADGIPDEPK